MPGAALSRAKPDHVGLLADMPALLESLVREPAGPPGPVPEGIRYEVEIARRGLATVNGMDSIAAKIVSRPDCGGVMWQVEEGGDIRYRCHIGHAYTAELMSVALGENLRSALAIALRALEDRISATDGLYRDASERGHLAAARSLAGKKSELEDQVKVLRDAIRRIDEITFKSTQD
jgi:two-component system, chemotaxis family, protein-glutamate methylesterase/glutaminase